jgi:pimeloyl-ACP methyl ester carboxylesterase
MAMQVNYINCNNLYQRYKMVYYSWGSLVDSSKVLLCLHGLNRNGRDWDFIGEALAKEGYYVIAPDIVGRGNSDYLPNPLGYDIRYYCADILRLFQVLNLTEVNLLGTSMGGIIGMAIAAMPDSPLSKIILNDIGAEIEFKGLQYIASYANTQPDFTNISDAKDYLKTIAAPFGDLPDEIWQHISDNSFQRNDFGNYELKRDVNLAQPLLGAMMVSNKNIELWDYWYKIMLPTLVIRGANSELLTVNTITRMKKTNPLLISIEIANAGHAPFLYSKEHIKMVSDFLKNN